MSEKIIITGHTKGLGKAIYEWHVKNVDDITGISRTTGHNIEDTDKIINLIKDFDVFINNAYYKDYQIKIYKNLSEIWKNKNHKIIINVSSRASDYSHITKMGEYAVNKRSLNDFSMQYQNDKDYLFKTIILKPGYVENCEKDIIDKKLSFENFLKVYKFVWTTRHTICLNDIRFTA